MTFHSPLAYAQREAPTRSLRSVEYDLLALSTQRLTAAWSRRIEDFSGLAAALTENQQLWLTLAADVSDPENGLPTALRARLFYLYEFTVHHSRAVLDGRGSVGVLADINTAVMRGLRGQGGGA